MTLMSFISDPFIGLCCCCIERKSIIIVKSELHSYSYKGIITLVLRKKDDDIKTLDSITRIMGNNQTKPLYKMIYIYVYICIYAYRTQLRLRLQLQ